MTANAIIDYDDISAFFDSVRNVFSNFSARHTQEAYQHRQQLADNATETTEGETLADSRGSDDVVSDTLSSARDSRKRKNSNEGSDGSDDDERRDGGSQQRREFGLSLRQHRQQRRMRMNRPSRMEGRKVMQSSCIILAMAWNHLPIIKKIMLRYVVEGLMRRVRLKNIIILQFVFNKLFYSLPICFQQT